MVGDTERRVDDAGAAERGDLRWGSIPGLVRDAAARFGDRPAVVDGDTTLSFGQLAGAVARTAGAVVAAGVDPGDRVAVWAPNRHEWILAALGAVAAGAVLVPVNTRYKGAEAGHVLERSGARLLFTVGEFLGGDPLATLRRSVGGPEAGRPVAGLPDLARVVLIDGAGEAATPWDEFHALASAAAGEEAERRAGAVGPADLSDVIFTSGTTGRPKGVMCAHGQTLRVFEVWSRLVGLREDDRYLVVNPFFHTFGYKAGVLAALMRGATLLPHAVFDAGQVMRRIADERVTFLPGPPTLYQSILNHPEAAAHDLSSLRVAVTGAAVVPVELVRRMRAELTFETVLTAYGLTECTGTATMCRPGDDAETVARTSGRAIPDTEVRVVDPAGNALPAGEPGEVVVRGYHVTPGYLGDPEATAEAIDADGWLHTGDVGVMDARGSLRITDRIKDLFIVGGFNAYPAEIEGDLLRHAAVGQVAVVGAPDERLGEVGVAFVVPRPGASLDPAALIAWAREEMANYKVPRRVEIVGELPVNASGKVLKYELRERARAMIRPNGG